MKRIISYLITAMMVFTMVPSIAFAGNADEQQTSQNLRLYIEQSNPLYTGSDSEPVVEVINQSPLTAADEISPNGATESEPVSTVEDAAAILRAGMVARQNQVIVNLQITADELTQEAMDAKTSAIFNAALSHTGIPNEGDSLMWVYENISTSISAGYDGTGYYAEFTFMPTYYTTAEQEEELTTAVKNLKSQLALDGKSDYEKVKAIYDYMTANITYDYDHYIDDSYKLQFTSYAALVNKTSVCQGYATLFYRMACEYGIDARVIAGTSLNNKGDTEGHSWNIVKLGGKYYNLDATWDSTWDADKATHDYFLKGSASFENHTRAAEFETAEFHAAYPMSGADYVPGAEPEDPTEPEKCTHDKTQNISGVDATCTSAGLTEGVKCSSCGEVLTPQITIPVLGHDLIKHKAKDPTCTEDGNIEYYTCSRCEKIFADAKGKKEITKPETVTGSVAHMFTEVTVAPTCTEPGQTKLVCIGCGKTVVTSTTLPLGHTPDGNPNIEPTCENDGLIVTVTCSVCGEIIKEAEVIPALGHTSKKTITKATTEKDGSITETCATCGKQLSKTTIAKIKSTILSKAEFVYDGKTKKPVVTVKNGKNVKLKSGTDYSVKFKNQQGKVVTAPKLVGKYTAFVTLKGNYSGTVKRTFTINPKATSISKLTKPAKKQIKVTWQKRTAQVTGYEIQYSTTKNFTKKTTKTLKVKSYKKNTATIKKLKAKKTYWVKIRTYKNVNGKTFYSKWSKTKIITTK